MMKKIAGSITDAVSAFKNQNVGTKSAIAAALGMLFFNFFIPQPLVNGAFYVLFVLIGFWLPKRDHILWLAGLASILAFVTISGPDAVLQRGFMLATIWLTAGIVGYLWTRSALLKAIVDTAAEGIITIDSQGIITAFNKMAENIFAYSADEAIGQNISMLMPSPWKEKHDGFLSNYLNGGKPNILGQYREVQGLRKDGGIFPLLIGVTEIKLGHKPIFTGVVRDISQRKKNEATIASTHAELKTRSDALMKANEELSQFAHVVSHDLKAPLRAIRNYSDWLADDLKDDLSEDHIEYIAGLKQAVNQAETLIEDLLDLSKIGRKENHLESIALNNFFDKVIASSHLDSETVSVIVDKKMPVINSSPVLLAQIFQNLILNGIKYNDSEKKIIHITYEKDAENHKINVKDNGIGIDPKYHASIFDIFQRLHTREEYEGTGIGLAIVKKAANHLGYSVRLDSKKGEGSVFTLCIPIEREI